MYETHFGLLRRPFLATPDPDCYVAGQSSEEALAGLTLCIEHGNGIGILAAAAGTGKTLLCRKLVVDLRDRYATVFLANSNFPTRRSLLQSILYELGQPYMRMPEQELRLELKTAATKVRPSKQAVLLVVDEAHLLNHKLLEELRTAACLDLDGRPLFHVVLSGQLPLEETLISPGLEALNQRVGCQVMLESLTREESAAYVAHRLRWAGGNVGDVFEPAALQMICHAADGLPRCLNQLSDHALLLAYVESERPVSEATVREALEDLKQLPLHWNEPTAAVSPLETLRAEARIHSESATSDNQPDVPDSADETSINESPVTEPVADNVIEVGATASFEVGAPADDNDDVTLENEPPAAVLEVGTDAGIQWPKDSEVAEESVQTTADANDSDDVELIESFESETPRVPRIARTDFSVGGDDCGFEEEVVVDRYAMLDAGFSLSEKEAKSSAAKVTSTSLSGMSLVSDRIDNEPIPEEFPTDEAAAQETVEFQIDAEAAQTPEELLDAIEPMISQVLEDDQSWDVESTATMSQTVIAPPMAYDEADWHEDENTVRLEEADVPSVEDALSVSESIEYDVVQPVDVAGTGEQAHIADEEERTRTGRYARLFSKLRRQQRKSA